MNNTSTNLTDSHTCSIGGVDLVVPVILVTGRDLLQLTRNVVGGTGICVPVGVYPVGGSGGGRRAGLRGRAGEGCVKALEAAQYDVAFPAA